MRTANLRSIGAAIVALAFAATPALAAEFDDPDWPCIQRKVPELSIGQMWSGPMPAADAGDRPEIRALASALAPRRNSIEEVAAQAEDFAATLPEAERPERLAELFSAVLARIDAERGQLIEGIGRYAQNQTGLSERIETLQGELAKLRVAADPDLDRIEEIEDTLTWETRIFRDRAQALTYVCETPVLLEQRAFAIARALAEQI